jgi:ribonuclease BN (tRNA processing enzyme)
MTWSLHFLGVGAASAPELGSASAMLERDEQPVLMIDCGPEALTAAIARHAAPPPALFITHCHLDHIGGLERLFSALYFDPQQRGRMPLYVPASLVALLQRRVADYPEVLAEGGANFWDAFHLVPVSAHFWHAGLRFEVFPVRHHAPDSAFGLALPGSFIYSGDTRPIAEVLSRIGDGDEPIAHDCGLIGNPSHSGIDDLLREYPAELQSRLLLYHYAAEADGDALAARGFRVARRGMTLPLSAPRTRLASS